MKLIRRRGSGWRAKKGSPAPALSREKSAGAVEGGGAGSNSRRVAPDDAPPVGAAGDAGSREEAFFEASPWLDSDCDDDFFSVNGDVTPARTLKLPTLEAIFKAEPLEKPPRETKLGDLLKEEEGVDAADRGGDADAAADRCCIPGFAHAAIGYRGRRRRR